MLIAVITLVVGAVLGAVLPQYFSEWLARYRSRRLARETEVRRLLAGDQSSTNAWLVAYYERHGAGRHLFRCRIGDFERAIPFLSKPEWLRVSPVLPGHAQVVQFARTSPRAFDVDSRLLGRRIELGQRLFDDDACYLDYVEDGEGALVLHTKPCRYFEAATTLVRLEEETFEARRRGDGLAKWRDQYLPGIDDLASLLKTPHPVGGAVALAIREGRKYSILIHTRSHATITVGGLKAVMPNFTLAPPPTGGRVDGDSVHRRLHDILVFNVVREYLEELFNYEALISAAASTHLDPYWFAQLPEAERLLELIDAQRLTLEFLGFGFDALSGSAVMALLMMISDEDLARDLRRTVEANWEVGRSESGVLEAEFVPIDDVRLTRWLEESRYHAGAAFTLARAIPQLRQRTT
jgi:hypothetical protein